MYAGFTGIPSGNKAGVHGHPVRSARHERPGAAAPNRPKRTWYRFSSHAPAAIFPAHSNQKETLVFTTTGHPHAVFPAHSRQKETLVFTTYGPYALCWPKGTARDEQPDYAPPP